MFKKQQQSLESILSGFTKTRSDLEGFVSSKKTENEMLQQEISQKQTAILANDMDIKVADRAIDGIKSLIGK